MIDKAMPLLVLLTVTLGLPQSGVLDAEPLPPRALVQIGDHRFYHGPGIACSVLSPDGRHIASAAHYLNSRRLPTKRERNATEPFIVLWDAATGERLRELRVPDATFQHLAFSPDGNRLAAAYTIADQKHGVAVFVIETGKLLWRRDDFKNRVIFLQFAAKGQRLRVSEWCGAVSAWDAASGKQLRLWKPPPYVPFQEDKEGICGVKGVLSPDGKVIAWEMHPFNERKVFVFVIGLRFQDAATDKLLYEKKCKLYTHLRSFAFSADNKRFAASDDDHNLIVWETATGKELVALNIPDMCRFVLAPDGRRAVIYEWARGCSRLRLWDLQSGKPSQELYPDFVLRACIPNTQQVFSNDGKTLLMDTDSTVRLFDTTTGKECGMFGHRAPVTSRFSADGRTLFTSCAEARCRWDVSSGKAPALLGRESTKRWEAECLAHSMDERLFLDWSEDGARVRDTATGHVLRKLERDSGGTNFDRFSPDATHVLLEQNRGDDNNLATFRLYQTKTGKVSGEFKAEHMKRPMFSPNGRLIAWPDRDGAVHLHDAVTGQAVRTLRLSRLLPKTEGDNNTDLLFTSDARQLIVSASLYDAYTLGDERETMLPLRVFQIASGREIARFYANPHKTSKARLLSCMACSPDGRLLALAEEESGIVRLIEIASGKMRAEFSGHRDGVCGLAFAPDGKTLASGGEDNVVFLWDVIGLRTPAAANKASESELAAWWSDLASADGQRAGVAVASLIRTPGQSVALLQQHMRPAEDRDEKRLAQLLADLDADTFGTRETASRELARLGERAEAAMRRALMNRPSPEARRRIDDLLNKLEPTPLPPETLRALRAIEVLEHVGTPAARCCLEALAKGAADARQTRAAKAALNRLINRR